MGDTRELAEYIASWPGDAGRAASLVGETLRFAAGLGEAPATAELSSALGQIESLPAGIRPQLVRTALRHGVRGWDRALVIQAADIVVRDVTCVHLRSVAEAWLSLFRGGSTLTAAWFDGATEHLRSISDPIALVELSVAESMCALEQGDIEHGVQAARLALRWADAEEMPQEQYLASLALARARRHRGTPHLSARIVGGLAKYAPQSWGTWLAWESVLAGAGVPDASSAVRGGPAGVLGDVVAALRVGGRSTSALPSGMPAFVQADFDAVRGVFGDLDGAGARADVQGWITGASSVVPRGLHVLAADVDTAFVVVGRDAAARRLLATAPADAEGTPRAASARRPERTEHGLCVLAFAGATGVDEGVFFKEVYGFDFEPRVHKSVFEMLLHRMRKHLGDGGSVERLDGRLTLKPSSELRIADPRCMPTLAEQIAGEISRRGTPSARDLAEALKVPLRTVQEALSSLSEDGGCVPVRDGRSVLYKIEDTTFLEPTRYR